MSDKRDVKQTTVERQTENGMRHHGLSRDQAQKIARESAERVNQKRREQGR